ncbi:unnamed protein product [Caenorhabditis angaria]|uniref:Uncharacterized protein n=1 Tax=Caenorhabditis angaria TaxID=860376 RepID=A0A9P1I9P3_9PELO|nr:unnamed protein product [Caenorhabditis angaria]
MELPEDIYRKIVNYALFSSSKSIFAWKNLNSDFRCLVEDEASRVSRTRPIVFDVEKLFFDEKCALKQQFYEQKSPQDAKKLHQDIRKLCDILEALLKIGGNLALQNFSAKSIGWICEEGSDEVSMKRAPFMLQKRVVEVLKRFQSVRMEYSPVFMKPSRFIRCFSHRFEEIKELDLGNVKPLAALRLRNSVFPQLVNLQKLTWHHANIEFLKKIANPTDLKELELTAHPVGRPSYSDFAHLTNFRNLEKLYLGLTCPRNPSRFTMEALLTLYQAIWKKNLGETSKKMLDSFENLREIGFWNAPEKIFIEICSKRREFKTMNFGKLSQDLSKMCSFDSIMQAFFKFEESNFDFSDLKIENLNMVLHSMPAVQLEYYLPNLMNLLNKMTKLENLKLFVKCIFGGDEMNSSWSLETKKEKLRKKSPILESNFKIFELHIDGSCSFQDFHRQIPPSIQKLSISLNLPVENPSKNQKSIKSLGDFIEKLADFNSFPEFEELYLQVFGICCMEFLVDKVAENLSNLKKLSIISMPCSKSRGISKNLLEKMRKISQNLMVSKEFHDILALKNPGNPMKIGRLFEEYAINPKGKFDQKFVDEEDVYEIPVEPSIVCLDDEISDEEEDDSMIDDGDGDPTPNQTLDELDLLEQKLEKESHRRHEKYLKKRRAKIDSESEPEPEEDYSDIVDFDQEDEEDEDETIRENGGFFDDEAIESDGGESEGESEPEGEDLADSDDEILFVQGPKKRKFGEDKENYFGQGRVKRNRIVLSDDED